MFTVFFHSSKSWRDKNLNMESNDCMNKDCSTIYRFQFASIAFLCSVYLPFTFHSNIWSLYTQPFTPVNCSLAVSNITTIVNRPFLSNGIKSLNQSECCPCQTLLNGNANDRRLWSLCQEWLTNSNEMEVRKATVIDEVSTCWFNICSKSKFVDFLVAFSLWRSQSEKPHVRIDFLPSSGVSWSDHHRHSSRSIRTETNVTHVSVYSGGRFSKNFNISHLNLCSRSYSDHWLLSPRRILYLSFFVGL